MLSYQHQYHAGNMADVHKHALLAWMLAYLTAKDKPLSYIETHAGRGLYDLGSVEARKTGEAAAGVTRVLHRFAADHPYVRVLERVRQLHGAAAYPGSPLIAALGLRADDTLHLAELHPQEFAALTQAMLPYAAICQKQDGMAMALALTPPSPRRGLLLIDPSYEVKADYEALPKLIGVVHRKWNVGVVVLWYPILVSGAHGPMLAELVAAHPAGLRAEVRFAAARDGHGMVGSGLFVLNPPYGLAAEAAAVARVIGAE